MRQWYFAVLDDFQPKVGFQTRFVVENEGRIFPHLWKITQVIPYQEIVSEWRYEGYSGCIHISFTLAEENDGTRLKLRATVIEDFPDDVPEFKRESGVKGWRYLIGESLKNYLE